MLPIQFNELLPSAEFAYVDQSQHSLAFVLCLIRPVRIVRAISFFETEPLEFSAHLFGVKPLGRERSLVESSRIGGLLDDTLAVFEKWCQYHSLATRS